MSSQSCVNSTHVANAILASEINSLKQSVRELKAQIMLLRSDRSRETLHSDCCLLYVRFNEVPCGDSIGKQVLEKVLQCPIVIYFCIRSTPSIVFKVKILKSHLFIAMSTSGNDGHVVRLWKRNKVFNPEIFMHHH